MANKVPKNFTRRYLLSENIEKFKKHRYKSTLTCGVCGGDAHGNII